MIRLGIIEDDNMLRRALKDFFDDEPGFDCLLTAASVEDFLESWKDGVYFDIVLSDIGLPGMSGIEGVPIIKRKSKKCQVVMLTIYEDTQNIFHALCEGASGYVSKQTILPKIKEALQDVYNDGAYMSPGVARKVTEYFNPVKPSQFQDPLTPREEQVLLAVEEGLPNRDIAKRLNISIETVKSHVKKIYLKLNINNRLDIIRRKHRY